MAKAAMIGNACLSAEISGLGAELTVLRSASGRDFLWNGDPAWWHGRSPLLFPIVGTVPNDQILVDGVRYPLKQHGLARISEFTLLEAGPAECRYRLESSEATRAVYPFDFTLDVRYSLDRNTLTISADVSNTGDRPLPMSFGFHPAFRWPLPNGGAREEHVLMFDAAEPAPIRRLRNGLLSPSAFPTPVRGNVLRLDDDLFEENAVIFDRPVSRGVTYRSPAGPAVRIRYPDMPNLGVWSKPGAPFVCIEPWHGYAAPENFAGELTSKDGSLEVAEGASASFSIMISITE
jgi:galactose mutarotase-like enzyme